MSGRRIYGDELHAQFALMHLSPVRAGLVDKATDCVELGQVLRERHIGRRAAEVDLLLTIRSLLRNTDTFAERTQEAATLLAAKCPWYPSCAARFP